MHIFSSLCAEIKGNQKEKIKKKKCDKQNKKNIPTCLDKKLLHNGAPFAYHDMSPLYHNLTFCFYHFLITTAYFSFFIFI